MRSAAALKCVPSAAVGVSVTEGTSWAHGSWVEITASAPANAVLAGILVTGGSFNNDEREVDIGIGAASSETVIATFRQGLGNSGNTAQYPPMMLPVPISGIGGQRIAARARRAGAGGAIGVKVLYLDNPSEPITTAQPLRCLPSAAAGVGIAGAGTAWANSSWVEVSSSLPTQVALAGLAFTTNTGADHFIFEFGIGAAGSEVSIGEVRGSNGTAMGWASTWLWLPGLKSIPAGTRLAVRLRKSGTGTNTWTAAILYYADLVATDNNWYQDDADPDTPAVLLYDSNGDALYVLLSWRSPVDGTVDDVDAVAGVTFNGAALTRGGHIALRGNTIEWWRLPAHVAAVANVEVTMNQARSVTYGVVNRSGWPTAIADHNFAAAGNIASLQQPTVTVPCGTGAESMSWLGFDRAGQDVTIGSGQSQEWNQEGEDDADGNQRSAGGIKTGLTSPSQTLAWTVATLDEYWGLGALSYGGAAAQRATQLVQLYEYDAYVAAPAAASACSGGGTNPAGTNPSAGTSLDNAISPEFWLEIDVGGTTPTTERLAKGPINDADSYKEPRVVTFGDVRSSLGDDTGLPMVASLDSVVADTDRLFRAYMDQLWSGASTSDALLDAKVRLYVRASDGATPELLWQGAVRDYKPQSDMTFRLTSEDVLSLIAKPGEDDDKMIPAWLTDQVADGTPIERMKGKPVPLPYGSLSDESLGLAAQGVCPAWYTQETSAFWPAYLPRNVHFHLQALGEIANVQHVFGADEFNGNTEPTTRARIPDHWWGVKAWAPHKPNWPFADPWIEIGGHRYTAVVLDQTTIVAKLAREGRIPLTWNGCGYKGANGQMLDAIEDQFLHFLINFGYGNYDGAGAFASSIPSIGSYSAIDTTTFAASKTATVNMRGSTIKGATLIGWDLTQRPLNDIVAKWCHSGGFDPGHNRYGQFIISRLDRTVAASGTTRTDLEHHVEGSFDLTPSTRRRFNIVPYVYGRNYVPALAGVQPEPGTRGHRPPYDGEWTSGLQTVDDGSAGTKRAKVQYFEMLRDSSAAQFVAEQWRDLYGKPRIVARWLERLTGNSLELGSVVPVTNEKGSGASGWIDRGVRVRDRIVHPDVPVTVELFAWDVNDLLP